MNRAFNAGFAEREATLANREPLPLISVATGVLWVRVARGYLLMVWPVVSRQFGDSQRKFTIGGHALLQPGVG